MKLIHIATAHAKQSKGAASSNGTAVTAAAAEDNSSEVLQLIQPFLNHAPSGTSRLLQVTYPELDELLAKHKANLNEKQLEQADVILIQAPPAASSASTTSNTTTLQTASSASVDSSSCCLPSSANGGTMTKSTIAKPSTALSQLVQTLNIAAPLAFICVVTEDTRATEDAQFRWELFQQGAHMVTSLETLHDLKTALKQIAEIHRLTVAAAAQPSTRTYKCDFCLRTDLPEDALHAHGALYHSNTQQQRKLNCPICNRVERALLKHIHLFHGPHGRGELSNETDIPNALYPYSLCIIRRPEDGRFLMVQEFCNSGYWLPGGHAENGETLVQAAEREALEEAGVAVELKGLLRLEYYSTAAANPRQEQGHTRMRAFFYGEPKKTSPPQCAKTLPDYESVGAVWASLEELQKLTLRGSEPLKWFKYIAEGGAIYPMSILKF